VARTELSDVRNDACDADPATIRLSARPSPTMGGTGLASAHSRRRCAAATAGSRSATVRRNV